MLVFAPTAFAQDDNSTGDNLGGDNAHGVYVGVYIYDDNPNGDDVVATPAATITPTSSATSTPSATSIQRYIHAYRYLYAYCQRYTLGDSNVQRFGEPPRGC